MTAISAQAEMEAFFLSRSAHSDIADELVASVKKLGEYEVRRALYLSAVSAPNPCWPQHPCNEGERLVAKI